MKTAVITGGTRGIGAGLVRDFLRSGWNVAYSGRSEDTIKRSLEILSGEFSEERYMASKCDVTAEEDLISLWDNAFNTFGRIDIWVNSAGTANDQVPFNEVPPGVFARIIDTNVKGLMLATHVAYNRMFQQGFGAIYNMEGLGSDGMMIRGMTPYGTSKRAVRYFTDAFAKEIQDGPVIVGTIAPGMVLTDMLLDPLRNNPANAKTLVRIYNILANEVETITPFLVRKMIGNTSNGAKIKYLTKVKMTWKFLSSPFSRRDVVRKYL